MNTLITDIPEEKQAKRGWKVELNGQTVEQMNRVRISHPKFGELNHGLTPGGWDGWSFHEIGGGGSVTVPFSVINDQLYVGVVEQNRPNQGGNVLNTPRGFLDPGEKHFEAAIREAGEELGVDDNRIEERIFRLDGDPMNPNSTFFETAEEGEGVKLFAFSVLESELQNDGDGYIFREDSLKPASKAAEGILKCRMIPWKQAAQLGDMFTVAAVGRLLAR